MAKIESWLHCDLKKAVQVQELKGNVFSLDNNGSRIRVRIFDDGEKATVSGTVTAKCILADDSTVNVNGSLATVDGQSVASVDIPQGCLLVPGTIRIAIKLTDSSVITTLAAVISTVYRTSTDNVITPSAQIIADWNQEISDALAAQDAQIEVQDGKIDDLKSALMLSTGNGYIQFSDPTLKQYINTNVSVGTVVSWDTPSVSISTNIKWAVVECSEGDKFILNGKGGNGDRLWAFLDSSKKLISKSNQNETANNLVVTAPENSAYIVINDEQNKKSFIGIPLKDDVNEIKSVLEDTVGYIFENRFVYDTQYNGHNIYTSGCSVTTSNEKLIITASATTIQFGNSIAEDNSFNPTLPYAYPLKVGDVSKIRVEVSNDTFNRCYVTFLNSSYVSLGISNYFVAVAELDVPENAEYCLLRIGSNNAVSGTSYTITVNVCDANKPHGSLLSYVDNKFEEDKDNISALQEIGYETFPGYLSNTGAVVAPGSDTKEIYTNLIPIKKGDTINISITLTESKSMWGAYCLYDENKNFISRTTSINTTGSEFERTITISSDSASFICYSFRTYGISEMKISMPNPSVVLFNTIPDISLVNYKNPIVKGVNHRGYNSIAPENTLSAFRLSRKMGFEYVETDVEFTSDGVAVLLHDATINRTARNADGTAISETVSIHDITYEQALTYDFGIYKGEQYAGTKIPTVAEFFALCRLLGLLPYVEFKSDGTYTQAQIEGVIDIAKSYGMADKTTWISFSDTFLGYVKAYDSKARLGYVCESPGDTQIATIISLRTEENEVFADCHYTSINSTGAGKCIRNGIPLEGWTCDSKADLLALNPYVSGVTTNSLNVAEILFFGGMIE